MLEPNKIMVSNITDYDVLIISSIDGEVVNNQIVGDSQLFDIYNTATATSWQGIVYKTIGLSPNTLFRTETISFRILGVGEENKIIYEQTSLSYSEIIFDIEHGIIYGDDDIIYTLNPEDRIFTEYRISTQFIS